MKKAVLRLVILALVSLTSLETRAQILVAPSIISSSGGYVVNENYSLSWTLGEIAVTTLHGDNMILAQGFQQPMNREVGIVPNEFNWSISVYPNPVENELRIQFNMLRSDDFRIEIQDVTGRVLVKQSQKKLISGDIVILNVSEFTPGIYFLKILSIDSKKLYVTNLTKL